MAVPSSRRSSTRRTVSSSSIRVACERVRGHTESAYCANAVIPIRSFGRPCMSPSAGSTNSRKTRLTASRRVTVWPPKRIRSPMLDERSTTIPIATPWEMSRARSVPCCGRARARTRAASASARKSSGKRTRLDRQEPASRLAATVEEKRSRIRSLRRQTTSATKGTSRRNIHGDSNRNMARYCFHFATSTRRGARHPRNL